MSELLVGCGNRRIKKITFLSDEWSDLTTLDIDPGCGADVVHDLDVLPYPFEDEQFMEVHAYEVLEHQGAPGDYKFFFCQFHEFWRMLKPYGILAFTCPKRESIWAWGDPSHKRIITAEQMTYLDQSEYDRQVGVTSMTDFRWLWKGDFRLEGYGPVDEHSNAFILRKHVVI